MVEFRWNDSNVDHIAEHGIAPWEAEDIVRRAKPPWPRKIGNGKYLAWAQTRVGRYLQVIFVLDPDPTVYVIHARPLTEAERRNFRRKKR